MVNGTPGWKGYYLSAYGLAVKRGYPGTEEEWLDSLHGANVEMRYENGELQWKHDTSEEWHTLEEFTALRELLEMQGKAAEAAAELAGGKAQEAKDAAALASVAAQAAESSAEAANSAAGAAVEAKEKTEAATEAAKTAAEQANTAAAAANEKAQAAGEAAASAGTAAEAAQEAGGSAAQAAELANSKASAAEAAAGQANTAAQAAQESKTAADAAAGAARTAAEAAHAQGNYAKEQGDRAAQLVGEIEDTDVGGMTADILALQNGKADLVNGKVPVGQLGVTAKRTCTFVIGTSTAGWTENDCDYLCDGTNDWEKIQGAMDSLPDSGGKIVLLEGEYFSNQHFEISKNITLCGSGSMSILTVDGNFAAIVTNSDSSFFHLCNLQLKGVNSTAFPVVQIHSHNVTIDNCWFSDGGHGIQVDWGNDTRIVRNNFSGITYDAVSATTGSITLLNNFVEGTNTGFSVQNAYGSPVLIADNILHYASRITVSNTNNALIKSNALIHSRSISFNGSENYPGYGSSISGNILYDMKDDGIRISFARSILVQGNVIYKGKEYGSAEYSISILGGGNNMVCNNYIPGKNYNVESSTGNQFINNVYE